MAAEGFRTQLRRSGAARPWTAALLCALALAACGRARPGEPVPAPAPRAPAHAIIPVPVSLELAPADTFTLRTSAAIVVETGGEEAARIGRFLADLIGNTVESRPQVVMAGEALAGKAGDTIPPSTITLAIDPARTALGEEGYELVVAREGVRIVARRPAGLFYGAQTLRQLLPPAVEYTAAFARDMKVPAAKIVDRPRFEWRGMMLDVSRHFLGVDEVKRFVDLIALYKMNRLHLHLSDDQGWRIEIPSWPELARVGGGSAVGGHPGGYYTREQYAEIVRYAQERFVTIVPEIDMPGHTNAALASYPELNCDGVAPPIYTGTRVGFSALCVDKDVTYEFIDDVVATLAALTPGDYIHIGGDEVEKLTHDQYKRFIVRVEGIVQRHGKRMIGWGEVAPANLSASAVVQHWKPDSSHLAVARGSKVILSPSKKVYLDMKYDASTPIGLSWAALIEVKDAYDWEPATWLPGVPESAVFGVEAPLWSETLGTASDFEYMAFPRIPAVAELGWSPAASRAWETFRLRLGAHQARWSALGVNFHRSPLLP